MEAQHQETTNVLNLKKVNHNNWSKQDYENLKKSKGLQQSIRGSAIIKDVISHLQIRDNRYDLGNIADNEKEELNYNTVYQKFYGESFALFLKNNKVSNHLTLGELS